jgi:hypothetical protein
MAPYFVIILCNILCDLFKPHGASGDVCAGNRSTTSGDRLFEKPLQSMTYSCSRPLYWHVVIFVPYTKGSVIMIKMRFYSRLANDEITTRGYRALPLQSVQLS